MKTLDEKRKGRGVKPRDRRERGETARPKGEGQERSCETDRGGSGIVRPKKRFNRETKERERGKGEAGRDRREKSRARTRGYSK